MQWLFRFIGKLFVLWLLYFAWHRLFFVLYQLPLHHRIQNQTDLVQAFFYGYRLEFATATILMGLPVLAAWLHWIIRKNWSRGLITVLTTTMLLVYAACGIGDAGLYREWHAKINVQALSHFKNPSEIVKTISIPLQLLFIVLVTSFAWLGYFVYKKWIKPEIASANLEPIPLWKPLLFLLLYAGASLVTIRGGITNLPISQSVAYFSKDNLANDIAVNPLYNLLQDITVQGQIPDASEYQFMPNAEAQKLLEPYFAVTKDSTEIILQTPQPNLVFIFLESWSADMVGCLGGFQGLTPHFDSISKEGILCTQAYAAGYISDQGIPAVLSGFPGLSKISVIGQPANINRLQAIPQDVKKLGYRSSFIYGGDLVFSNIKGYLLQTDFDSVIDYKTLKHLPQGQLGVHDEYTFPELLQRCDQSKQPFLNALFTLSTHMPYDFKSNIKSILPEGDVEPKYSRAIQYADEALGKFFTEAKTKPWYNQTLFILVADHSHNTFTQSDPSTMERHKIPMLFVGGALKPSVRGRQISRVVSQLDIVTTLNKQIQFSSKPYRWSRDIFNPYTYSGAYFPFFGGTGFVTDSGYASSYLLSGHVSGNVQDSIQKAKQYKVAQSFLQTIYNEIYSSEITQ